MEGAHAAAAAEEPRQVSGIATALVVASVRDWGGPEAVAQVCARAGDPRPPAVLADERAWSSYDRFCRLLRAATEVVGDPTLPRRAGEAAVERQVGTTTGLLLRALGSPAAVYRHMHRTAPKIATMATTRALQVGAGEALIQVRLDDGCAPDATYRDFTTGLLAVVPRLFGLPTASTRYLPVDDPQEWVVAVSWPRRHRWGRAGRHDALATARQENAVLTSHLQTLQRTVSDLVSPAAVEEVLARVVTRSAVAVQAPRLVLAIRPRPYDDPLVYAEGMAPEESQTLAHELLTGSRPASGSELVVPVRSARRDYGWFLAANPSGLGFLPGEEELLHAYAALAAAALDSATALQEARAQGRTAHELLDLASTLSGLTDATVIAQALARSLTTLTGAERGSVYLWDPDARALTLCANAGMDDEVDRRLLGSRITEADTPELAAFLAAPGLRLYDRDAVTDPFIRGLLDDAGSTRAAVVPLIGGELFGAAVASWSAGSDRVLPDGFAERIQGLADQGTTSLRTARLVQRMRHQALHDGLTGLANRTLLADRIHAALLRAKRTGRQVAVLFCDLDDFKAVNDRLGHAAGDALLVEVAHRLRTLTGPEDVVARLGGDEFAVLLNDVAGVEDAEAAAERLLASMDRPVEIDGRNVPLRTSVGVAMSEGQTDPEALLRHADTAMYTAKRAGKHTHARFRPQPEPPPDPPLQAVRSA